MKRFCVLVCVLAMTILAAGQTAGKRSASAAVDQEDVQALANDVARMRTLLQQMQMNLALVQTTTTPLKHQFELEIDMWSTVLAGMERRLQRMRASTTSGVARPVTVPLQPGRARGMN